jgi:hypothetical protein
VVATGGEQRRLIRQLGRVGPGHSWRARGKRFEVDTGCERDRARVHLENLPAAEPVGWLRGDATVESAWAQ